MSKLYDGIMTLGTGHSLMVGNKPKIIDDKALSDIFFKASKTIDTVGSFGLFGSDLNYNTYYPDVKPEDLVPTDDEFIEPVYRLLSKCIVSQYYPTDFGYGDALKESMDLLVGQTVNCDHETNVGNAIGSIKSTYWQESYKMANSLVVPAGINGTLLIDAKANPRIARGIMMAPPSIHSNSVTVRFKWEKSHQDLTDEEFYQKLGTYDKDGNLYKRNVVKIISYQETSLVSHGADPFAKKVGDDGKIINTKDAKAYSFSEKLGKSTYYFGDFKDLPSTKQHDGVLHNTMIFINEREEGTLNNINNQNEQEEKMEELLNSLFGEGLLTLQEGQGVTQDNVVSLIRELVTTNQTLNERVETLENSSGDGSELVTSLQGQIEKSKPLVELANTIVTELRNSTVSNYTKLMGEKVDESMLNVINNADYTTLGVLSKNYETQLNEKYPLSCKECGSENVSRGSAASSTGGEGDASNKQKDNVKDTQSAVSSLRETKLRG